jgi:hypothetical protein
VTASNHNYREAGLKGIKVFPKEIPVPDGLQVSGILGASEANNFLADILVKTPRFAGITVFPYGIPWPEIFRVRIGLGATVAASDRDGDSGVFQYSCFGQKASPARLGCCPPAMLENLSESKPITWLAAKGGCHEP